MKWKATCFNCLEGWHRVKNCSTGNCLKCDKKYNTLLHRTVQNGQPNFADEGSVDINLQIMEVSGGNNLQKSTAQQHHVHQTENLYVFLAT